VPPNILVIWGDDIGITNLSCYSDGLMGYRTPNIDRIAAEGMRFTDSYGEQSCTAGRASFITGQSVYRTGLSKVGMPGADVGLQAEDATIAQLLKPLGYATGQFGKNHLATSTSSCRPSTASTSSTATSTTSTPRRSPSIPTGRRRRTSRASTPASARAACCTRGRPTPTTRPRTGAAAETPFFCWFNTTHMHFRTHAKPESVGQARRWQSPYHDTMIDHDKIVGQLLDKLDELGLTEDTIVVYSTDNGPHMNTWPDGGMTPFRSEKNTNWEGAFRVPQVIRWPGKIAAGVVSNEIVQHHDWLPTFLAAAGEPDIVDKLKAGHDGFKVHIDGYNLLPYLTGEAETSPRKGLVYFSDDGDVLALRFDNWKVVFMEQRVQGTLQIWAEPFVALRVPKLYNLRMDPFERADVTSNTYYDWIFENDYIILAATGLVTQFLATFEEFPPRQKAASFTIDQVVAKLESVLTSGR
jgi:arylsulfatase